jgi:hypothetical protein
MSALHFTDGLGGPHLCVRWLTYTSISWSIAQTANSEKQCPQHLPENWISSRGYVDY